jgi:hypothetical protein
MAQMMPQVSHPSPKVARRAQTQVHEAASEFCRMMSWFGLARFDTDAVRMDGKGKVGVRAYLTTVGVGNSREYRKRASFVLHIYKNQLT